MAGERLTSRWVKSEYEDAEKVGKLGIERKQQVRTIRVGKLGMQRKGHKDNITGAERQWEEGTFMQLFLISSDRNW